MLQDTSFNRPALLIIDLINNFNFTHGEILAKKMENVLNADISPTN